MVNGYGQDIDVMWESDSDRLWEELNDVPEDEQEQEPEEEPEEDDDLGAGWYNAMYQLQEAFSQICKAAQKIYSAAGMVDGMPEEYRIESLAQDAEKLADFVEKQVERMGERAAS